MLMLPDQTSGAHCTFSAASYLSSSATVSIKNIWKKSVISAPQHERPEGCPRQVAVSAGEHSRLGYFLMPNIHVTLARLENTISWLIYLRSTS
jgi:hypothetical protein